MKSNVSGIHHITALAGDPQENLDFYAGVLGLRLVKKTINYDDPGTYHLYFGDGKGSPGSILTFFPWTSKGHRGQVGAGQVTAVAFSVPQGSVDFWRKRLADFNIEVEEPTGAGNETRLRFRDPDGLHVELVDTGDPPAGDAWIGALPEEDAIRGFHSATLSVGRPEKTAELLVSVLGFRHLEESGDRMRFTAGDGGIGTMIELVADPRAVEGRMGVGVVHHIAWRAADDEMQAELRGRVTAVGLQATTMIDRTYFHSVYFREPGNILFEIATDPPGFTVDEPVERLGANLMLPPWLETHRAALEQALPPLEAPHFSRDAVAWRRAG